MCKEDLTELCFTLSKMFPAIRSIVRKVNLFEEAEHATLQLTLLRERVFVCLQRCLLAV